MTTLKRNARLLMCAPEHFAVSYAINPWMDPASWARDNRAPAAAARVPAESQMPPHRVPERTTPNIANSRRLMVRWSYLIPGSGTTA